MNDVNIYKNVTSRNWNLSFFLNYSQVYTQLLVFEQFVKAYFGWAKDSGVHYNERVSCNITNGFLDLFSKNQTLLGLVILTFSTYNNYGAKE